MTEHSTKKERICIKTEKVFDWIVNEADFTDMQTIALSPGSCDTLDTVTCEVTDVVITEVPGTRQDQEFIIDKLPVTLQEVMLQKVITYTITATFNDGTPPLETPFTLTRFEQVFLCAPEGTTIVANDLENDCFITSQMCPQGTADLTVEVNLKICQNILVCFPVVVELKTEFCTPRDVIPFTCPTPGVPQQCPELFPPPKKKHH
ncbi:hypothetical protein WAK64_08500 [Bacillus spongiae]|uniref:DUF3794 domain-containing protein n=1 Tax=Bacillus spongiae TaxID=2683610 RepID=A0ABU8HCM7_9BACI